MLRALKPSPRNSGRALQLLLTACADIWFVQVICVAPFCCCQLPRRAYPPLPPLPQLLLAVFDGHGGRAVSQFCAAHLAEEFVRSDAYRRGDLAAAITGAEGYAALALLEAAVVMDAAASAAVHLCCNSSLLLTCRRGVLPLGCAAGQRGGEGGAAPVRG